MSKSTIPFADLVTRDLVGWDRITDHRTGTDGDAATAQWLLRELAEVGLAGKLDTFSFQRLDPGRCGIQLPDEWIAGVPMFDGPVANQPSVSARLGTAGDTGTIAVVAAPPFDAHPAVVAMQKLRRTSTHPAMVRISEGSPTPGISMLNAQGWTNPFGPPVLQVSSSAAASLERAVAANCSAKLHVAGRYTSTTASNVQVHITGREPTLAPVIVMTPLSGWWTCTSERGGGIAAWLAIARHFAAHPPERSVVLTANTGHELSHIGLDHLLTRHPDWIKGAHAWLHLGANFAAANGSVRLQASSDEWLQVMADTLTLAGGHIDATTPTSERPLGEARNIHDGGGRFVSILGGNPYFHHPDDRWPHAIDLAQCQTLVRGLVNVAIDLAGSTNVEPADMRH